MSLSPAQRLQQRIPFAYKFLILWFEPFAALNGAVMCLFTPDAYFETVSPLWTPLASSPHFQVVFDQLAATYVLFAFNEAVVLRLTSDLRVWKAVLLGIVVCDLLHIYATGKALGGLHMLVSPALWRWQDWVNLLMLYVPISMRIAFCLGVGIRSEVDVVKKRS